MLSSSHCILYTLYAAHTMPLKASSMAGKGPGLVHRAHIAQTSPAAQQARKQQARRGGTHLWLVHLALLDAHSACCAAAHPACIWQQQSLLLSFPQYVPAPHALAGQKAVPGLYLAPHCGACLCRMLENPYWLDVEADDMLQSTYAPAKQCCMSRWLLARKRLCRGEQMCACESQAHLSSGTSTSTSWSAWWLNILTRCLVAAPAD